MLKADKKHEKVSSHQLFALCHPRSLLGLNGCREEPCAPHLNFTGSFYSQSVGFLRCIAWEEVLPERLNSGQIGSM